MKRAGLSLLAACAVVLLAGPALAPHEARQEFRHLLHAPPSRIQLRDGSGRWQRPYINPWRLEDRLEQRYTPDRARSVPLVWFTGGRFVQAADASSPLLLLGADSFGRDIFSRLLAGGRLSLAVAITAAAGALVLGTLIGGIAGYAGGRTDEALMRVSEFVLVLPIIYVVLALRAVMPLVLPAPVVFVLMTLILSLAGWPYVARGVRAMLRAEARLDYTAAAVSLGASHARVLWRHLLPATRGFLAAQLSMLVPAFILAEATISFVGLGFPDPVPSWGTMLQEAANLASMTEFPWTLAPAAALFIVVLAFNLVLQGTGAGPLAGPRVRHRAD